MFHYRLYIKDIIRMIKEIEETTSEITLKKFEKDLNLPAATTMRLQVIGESIHKLPAAIKKQNIDIDWKEWEKTRNIISHSYYKIEKEMLWDIVKEELPLLKKAINKIKRESK